MTKFEGTLICISKSEICNFAIVLLKLKGLSFRDALTTGLMELSHLFPIFCLLSPF